MKKTINIGIDLGTTNSSIALFEKNRTVVCKNFTDDELTPSVVRIDEASSLVVGRNAYQRLLDDSENTVGGFKRWMGTQQRKIFNRSGRIMTPEELSAEVLKELRIAAKETRDLDVTAAVITVPASFEVLQCDATVRAARLAGISHSPLLQEPIAASIAYGLQDKSTNGKWLVYDLGGGTFDAALISLEQGRLSVVDHSGDNYLGGSNFDECIVDSIVIPELKNQFDLKDLSLSNKSKYGLLFARALHAAERAKIEVTRRDEAVIEIQFIEKPIFDNSGKPINARITLRRSDYEKLISKYIEKTANLCNELMRRQHLESKDVEKIILVGGPTKTPYLRQMLKDAFGIPLEFSIDPMTVVAQGAAIFATAQFVPDNLTQIDKSKLQVSLQYDPLTNILEPFIGGKIQDYEQLVKKYGAMHVQIKRGGGDWQSGKISFQAGGMFATQLHLNKGDANIFYITVFSEDGTALPTEPDSFQVLHGLSVAEAPLIRSIGVALEDGSFEILIEKNVPLPASGRKEFKTTRGVKAGDENSKGLDILVYEGEYEHAENNRPVGHLLITGKDLQRDVPENTRVEIRMKVDEQRHITVEAELAGQKVTGFIYDETGSKVELRSPKPNIDLIEKELDLQKNRFENLKKSNEQSAADPLAKEKFEIVKKELVEADYDRDIDAARGGDQTACEKLDRQLKDLKAKLDAAEYLNQWPSKCAEFRDAIKSCRWAVENYGDAEEREKLASIMVDAESALANKDQKRIVKLIEIAMGLYWSVLMKLDEWWIGQFQNMLEGKVVFKDPNRAKQLLQEGASFLRRNDIETLKTIMQQLWDLMSPQDQKEASKKLEHSGLRKG